MRQVADGVFEIGISFVHAHLVVIDDGVVLVDTGLPRRSAKVEQALHDARRTVGEVRAVLFTHWHADHTGGGADLVRRSGARTVAHALDAPVISGAEPMPLTRLQKATRRSTRCSVPTAPSPYRGSRRCTRRATPRVTSPTSSTATAVSCSPATRPRAPARRSGRHRAR